MKLDEESNKYLQDPQFIKEILDDLNIENKEENIKEFMQEKKEES